jgi:hypothetical protein
VITIEQIEKEELGVEGLRILHSKLDRIERALARSDGWAGIIKARLRAIGYEVREVPAAQAPVEEDGWQDVFGYRSARCGPRGCSGAMKIVARRVEAVPPKVSEGLAWADVVGLTMRWPDSKFEARRPHWKEGEHLLVTRDYRLLRVGGVSNNDYDANDWAVRRVE